MGSSDSCLFYSSKGLKISLEIGDKVGASYCYANLGNENLSLGKMSLAKMYLEKSYEIALEIDQPKSTSIASRHLYQLYSKVGMHEEALEI